MPKEHQGKVINFSFHGKPAQLRHGSVVTAAITSCTNTSNPAYCYDLCRPCCKSLWTWSHGSLFCLLITFIFFWSLLINYLTTFSNLVHFARFYRGLRRTLHQDLELWPNICFTGDVYLNSWLDHFCLASSNMKQLLA